MATKTKREKLAISFLNNPEEEIKKKIRILPEFENLIPPLAHEEFHQLRQNILTEGCREPLILWHHLKLGEYILIDGHNRYRICTENSIKFNIQLRDFSSTEEAKDWMLANQLGRRNLTSFQQSYLRGKRYANEKQAHGGHRVAKRKDTTSPTASQLAEEYGVNEKTIRRDEQFALGLDKLAQANDQLRWQILNGEIKAKKKTIIDFAEEKSPQLRKIKKELKSTDNLEQALRNTDTGQTANLSDSPSPTLPSEKVKKIQQQINRTTAQAIHTGNPSTITKLRRLVDQLEENLK